MAGSRRLMLALNLAAQSGDPGTRLSRALTLRSAAQRKADLSAEISATMMILDALGENGDRSTLRAELRQLADRDDLPTSLKIWNVLTMAWEIKSGALSTLLEKSEEDGAPAHTIEALCAELIESAPGPFAKGEAYSQVGHSLMRRDRAAEAIHSFGLSSAAYAEVAAIPEQADALENSASVCHDVRRYPESIEQARAAIALYQQSDDAEGVTRCRAILQSAMRN